MKEGVAKTVDGRWEVTVKVRKLVWRTSFKKDCFKTRASARKWFDDERE